MRRRRRERTNSREMKSWVSGSQRFSGGMRFGFGRLI